MSEWHKPSSDYDLRWLRISCSEILQLCNIWERLHRTQDEEAGRHKNSPLVGKRLHQNSLLCLDFCVCICAHSKKLNFHFMNGCENVFPSLLGNVKITAINGDILTLVDRSMYKPLLSTIHMGLISNLRRGRFWHDWWRTQLVGCCLPVWSNKNGCSPGRSETRRNRMSRWRWIHRAGWK